MKSETLFFVAAEESGDRLGGKLIAELKSKMPHIRCMGVGGKSMQEAGLELLIPSSQFEVMGFTALFPAAYRLFKNFHRIKRAILKEQPKAVILIDYAEFNMLLARALRKKGYRGKLVQYVVPSVWAWRKGRVKSLAKHYDLLLSILPFEKSYFAKQPVEVSFVGHPLTSSCQSQEKAKREYLALFPGSRTHEVEENLQTQLQAAKSILKKRPELTLAISCASEKLKAPIKRIATLPYKLVEPDERHQLMQRSAIALATCGTVILELALFKTATVVCYKVSLINYLIGRTLFRINLPYYSLPNIILQKELFPEHMGRKISGTTLSLLAEKMSKKEIAEECNKVREALETEKTASEEIYALLLS